MIVYYGGPEGSCKTVMMGRECYIHHRMGGDIYAFPGFEVKNKNGKVISHLLNPFEVYTTVMELNGVVIAIDEIQNFINHHNWWNKIIDILTYGIAAQRRKRNLVILATGPIFDWLPHDLKMMFHEVVHMADRHWQVKSIPRGYQAVIIREDRRGVLSGQIGYRTHPKIFHAKKWWPHVDTYAPVDVMHQFERVEVRAGRTVMKDGRVLSAEEVAQLDYESRTQFGRFGNKVKDLIDDLKQQGITSFPKHQMYEMVRDITGEHLTKRAIGQLIGQFGVWLPNRADYYVLD